MIDQGAGWCAGRAVAPAGLSRRSVLLGAAAVLAAAAGCSKTVAARPAVTRPGKLVPALIASSSFTIAHRGGSGDWPEMSLYAYQQSVAAGVDGLEISLARTSDGVWFGLHDDTLDRTSGTTAYLAADHTWAQIQQHQIKPVDTTNQAQPARPYLRFDDLVAAYGSTHSIFVDPKVASPQYYPELLALMARLVQNPQATFVGKGYCTAGPWARAATGAGYQTWGYFYGQELAVTPDLFTDSGPNWSMIGLDVAADDAQWAQFRSAGKPVVGFFVTDRADRNKLLARGAKGLMVDNPAEVVTGPSSSSGGSIPPTP